jgi:hypothetical protein
VLNVSSRYYGLKRVKDGALEQKRLCLLEPLFSNLLERSSLQSSCRNEILSIERETQIVFQTTV